GGKAIAGIACINKASQRTHEFRDLSIAVQAGEAVLVAFERIEHRVVLEAAREREPALIAGIGIEVRQDFVHAAKLGVEHFLKLRIVEFGEDAFGPGGKLDFESEGGLIAGKA